MNGWFANKGQVVQVVAACVSAIIAVLVWATIPAGKLWFLVPILLVSALICVVAIIFQNVKPLARLSFELGVGVAAGFALATWFYGHEGNLIVSGDLIGPPILADVVSEPPILTVGTDGSVLTVISGPPHGAGWGWIYLPVGNVGSPPAVGSSGPAITGGSGQGLTGGGGSGFTSGGAGGPAEQERTAVNTSNPPVPENGGSIPPPLNGIDVPSGETFTSSPSGATFASSPSGVVSSNSVIKRKAPLLMIIWPSRFGDY